MTLSQLVELGREYPIPAVMLLIIGGTIVIKKKELPVWDCLIGWLNARLDGLGKRLNASVAKQIAEMRETQEAMQEKIDALEAGQQAQKERADRVEAERHREQILQFNLDLINDRYLDREAFVEALLHIDLYEAYCREHPDYPNSRADAAIENIKNTYAHKMKHGFHKIKFVKEV